ncbi:MAG: hypothetical protein H7Z40_20440 [Phycisphaerae bacterium]|nr:hypothetical protein [Gemmatimonadaceae bacterium]
MTCFPLKRSALLTLLLVIGATISLGTTAHAQQQDSSVAVENCLKAWGKHPFGTNPKYRTMPVSVKVFGIGNPSIDSIKTSEPELVLIKPSVNVMGGSTVELRNPNGWYCFVTNVNVMGKMKIQAHCTAHLAQSHDGVTAMGEDAGNKSVTVMGKTEVKLMDCASKGGDTGDLPVQRITLHRLAATTTPPPLRDY